MILKVYHGGTDVIVHPSCTIGKTSVDFGKGFYVTPIYTQAKEWAQRKASNRKAEPIVNHYSLDFGKLQLEGKGRIFTSYDKEWLDFVVANRMEKYTGPIYDFVQGGIADDRVVDTVKLYMLGFMTIEFAIKRLAMYSPNNQICLKSQCLTDKYLHYEQSEYL